MRIPRLPARPWVAVATVVVAAAILFTVLHQGNANANTGPPETPDNTLAHLIVPDGEEPRIRVGWDAPEAPATGYTITRADGQIFSANGATTTYSDHSVQPGQSYTYNVAAHNAQGTSALSTAASATVPPPPSRPADLAASLEDPIPSDTAAVVTLSWTPATVPPAAACETAYPINGYAVHRHDGASEEELADLDANTASFTDHSATFGVSYTYRVSAHSAIGSGEAAAVNAVTPPRPVGVPKELTANISNLDAFDGSVTLEWQSPGEGPAVTGYRITRKAGNAEPVVLADHHDDVSYVDDSVSTAVPYSYTVAARSADNVSADTSAVSVEVPAAVTDVMATVSNGQVQLTWNPDRSGREVVYRVQRRTGNQEWHDLGGTTGLVLVPSHTDATAEPDVTHTYRVQTRITDGGGAWTESDPVTIVALPGTPGNVTVEAEGNDNVITWNAPDSESIDGYRVRHATDAAAWQTLADDIAETNHRHTGAQADVTHHYAVQAYNTAGNGPWSEPASTTRIMPPATPQNVSAELDGNDIVVTWTRPDTVHISGYTVRRQAGDADPMESDRLLEDQTSFRMTDVAGDVMYRLAVRAHNDGGQSDWSEEVEVMRRLTPSAPTSVAVTVGENDIVLSWEVPETGTPDGYHVQHGEQDADALQTESLDADQTSFTHSDNVEGVAYRYRVRAHNTAGESAWSETLTATRTLAPPAPNGLSVATSGSVITLSWNAPDGGVVEGYEVEHGIAGSDDTATASVAATETSFAHDDGRGDTRYSYRVRSVNSAGESDWSEAVEAMWVIPPTTPTGVSTDINGDDIRLSWTRPDSAFVDAYHVERRAFNTQDWSRVQVDGDATAHTHAAPTPGTTYEYRVRALNAGGVSDWTDVVTGSWFHGAAPPARLFVVPFGDQILLQWLPSATRGVTGYDVRYRVDGGEWALEPTQGRRPQYYSDWSHDETLREYSVRALIGDEAGDWSAIQPAVISRPAVVPNVQANREGPAGVRLHWDLPATGAPALFVVDARSGDSGSFHRVGSVAGHTTTYRVQHQQYGTTAQYRVTALNHLRLSGPHSEDGPVTVTMPSDVQQFGSMPASVRLAMVDRGTARLSWSPPQDRPGDVSNYRIYRKPVSDSRRMGDSYHDHVLVALTAGPTSFYVDATAEPGVAYEYGVSAYRDGYSAPWGSISRPVYTTPW